MDDWIKWVGGTVISLITILFGSRIIESWLRRRWKTQDNISELSLLAQTNTMDVSSAAFKIISTRLQEVEDRLDKTHVKQMVLVEENAELKRTNEQYIRENAQLTRENERIGQLMQENSELMAELENLKKEVQELKVIIQKFEVPESL